MSYELQQPKPKKRGCLSTVWGLTSAAIGVLILIGIIGSMFKNGAVTPRTARSPANAVAILETEAITPTITLTPLPTNMHGPTVTATNSPVPTSTPLPTNTPLPTSTSTETPLPTNTPTPVPTLSSVEALRAAIVEALGDSDRDVERITKLEITPVAVLIEWSINGRYGARLARFDARADAVAILKIIHELNPPYEFIVLTGTFQSVDKFGNQSEVMVMRLNYEHETMDAINWQDENFVRDSLPYNIYDIADSHVVNPAFETLD